MKQIAGFLAALDGLPARDRERMMLSAIGCIARGDLLADDVSDTGDLGQLAYLASLARNRVTTGGEALTRFMRSASSRLAQEPAVYVAHPQDPLQTRFGAPFHMDPGKVRSEANLHVASAWCLLPPRPAGQDKSAD